jgi:YidC/Oxa1 family membrane protein insertase
MKVIANPVLSQAELSNRFQGAQKSGLNQTLSQIRENKPPGGALEKVINGAFKDVKGTVNEIKDAASGVISKGKESLSTRVEKSDRKQAAIYEKKRQEQIKKEGWAREAEQRAKRAARKYKD